MIHVVVGIVLNAKEEVLIAQRPLKSYGGGLWEFPGGKLESNEDPFSALQREFLEEVGIQIHSANPWLQIEHDYQDRVVLLDTWQVLTYSGEAHGAEGQLVRWVKLEDLQLYQFPAGNHQIIKKLEQRIAKKSVNSCQHSRIVDIECVALDR